MPTCPTVSSADSGCCWRPYRYLYLNATSALTCPLMENAFAAKYRVYGSGWDYYTSLPDLLRSEPFRTLRWDMAHEGGHQATCGNCNCGPEDRVLVQHPPAMEADPYYWFKFLALSITDHCHGNCRHCYQDHSTGMIPHRVMADLVDHARAERVALMGGEIFHLAPDQLDHYLMMAARIGQGLVAQTSGDGSIAEHLGHYKWDEMRISVDALHRETHKYIRRGINYDAVWSNLALCTKVLGERVIVMVTAMGPNLEELPFLIPALTSRGVKRIRINPIFMGGRATPDMLIENNLELWAKVRPKLEEQIAAAEQSSTVIEWPGLKKVPVRTPQQ